MGNKFERSLKMRTVAVLFALVACALAQDQPDTVTEQIPRYIGRWYQTHGNRLGWLTYGDQAMCNTADYYIHNDTTITLVNANRQETPDGEYREVDGRAWVPDTTDPGKLYLQIGGVPFVGDYWVLRLGPPTYGEEGQYEWSIVSGPDRSVLFILARDVESFERNYQAELLQWLEDNGFTGFWTAPVPIPYHGPRCLYREY